MSAPALSLTLLSLPLAALAGSLHCAAMCGPIRLLCLQTARARFAYQAGRGLAYATLGTLAGALSWSIPWWALLLSVAVFTGFSLLGGHLPVAWQRIRATILARSAAHPFPLGLASGLLPCGLLHAWVLVAAASGSPLGGALTLASLWLGTLPALEVGTWVVARPVAKARGRFPRAVPLAILLLAIAPMLWRSHFAWAQASSKAPQRSCHEMSAMSPAN